MDDGDITQDILDQFDLVCTQHASQKGISQLLRANSLGTQNNIVNNAFPAQLSPKSDENIPELKRQIDVLKEELYMKLGELTSIKDSSERMNAVKLDTINRLESVLRTERTESQAKITELNSQLAFREADYRFVCTELNRLKELTTAKTCNPDFSENLSPASQVIASIVSPYQLKPSINTPTRSNYNSSKLNSSFSNLPISVVPTPFKKRPHDDFESGGWKVPAIANKTPPVSPMFTSPPPVRSLTNDINRRTPNQNNRESPQPPFIKRRRVEFVEPKSTVKTTNDIFGNDEDESPTLFMGDDDLGMDIDKSSSSSPIKFYESESESSSSTTTSFPDLSDETGGVSLYSTARSCFSRLIQKLIDVPPVSDENKKQSLTNSKSSAASDSLLLKGVSILHDACQLPTCAFSSTLDLAASAISSFSRATPYIVGAIDERLADCLRTLSSPGPFSDRQPACRTSTSAEPTSLLFWQVNQSTGESSRIEDVAFLSEDPFAGAPASQIVMSLDRCVGVDRRWSGSSFYATISCVTSHSTLNPLYHPPYIVGRTRKQQHTLTTTPPISTAPASLSTTSRRHSSSSRRQSTNTMSSADHDRLPSGRIGLVHLTACAHAMSTLSACLLSTSRGLDRRDDNDTSSENDDQVSTDQPDNSTNRVAAMKHVSLDRRRLYIHASSQLVERSTQLVNSTTSFLSQLTRLTLLCCNKQSKSGSPSDNTWSDATAVLQPLPNSWLVSLRRPESTNPSCLIRDLTLLPLALPEIATYTLSALTLLPSLLSAISPSLSTRQSSHEDKEEGGRNETNALDDSVRHLNLSLADCIVLVFELSQQSSVWSTSSSQDPSMSRLGLLTTLIRLLRHALSARVWKIDHTSDYAWWKPSYSVLDSPDHPDNRRVYFHRLFGSASPCQLLNVLRLIARLHSNCSNVYFQHLAASTSLSDSPSKLEAGVGVETSSKFRLLLSEVYATLIGLTTVPLHSLLSVCPTKRINSQHHPALYETFVAFGQFCRTLTSLLWLHGDSDFQLLTDHLPTYFHVIGTLSSWLRHLTKIRPTVSSQSLHTPDDGCLKASDSSLVCLLRPDFVDELYDFDPASMTDSSPLVSSTSGQQIVDTV